ncbi:NAD-dependent epimerase/dehydratase family protein [Streptosporangium sp. NPDC048047]|uniref:NAD-dependent epimerase/dehydratase family protein n=1 Tax=Streptosporangium sp. NPDC048047 TaxID=3155748 RepID=UPI0034346E23
MRILVTGGAGFIGANLCHALAARPEVERVTVLDDLSSGFPANLDGTGADLAEGSVLDEDLLARLVPGVSTVFHLAARPSVPRSLSDPAASHEVNATGTLRVLEACRRTGAHVVLASSSSVYGDSPEPVKHEDLPTRPLSPYGASKLAAESYALAYAGSFGLPVLPLRFFNVYGPLQPAGHAYAAVVPAFVSAALRGLPAPIHGDGRQTRDFTYVGSVTAVLAEAAVRRVTSAKPVNLAFGTSVSLLRLRETLSSVLGTAVATSFLPPRAADIRDSRASCRLLSELFPGVRPVPLEEGLRMTVAWFRNTADHVPAAGAAPAGAPGALAAPAASSQAALPHRIGSNP